MAQGPQLVVVLVFILLVVFSAATAFSKKLDELAKSRTFILILGAVTLGPIIVMTVMLSGNHPLVWVFIACAGLLMTRGFVSKFRPPPP